jgi:two-component system, OmpR family, manganese sensing sensor histidine kinase
MNLLFQSTRLRLAIWYTIVTAILLLLFATGVYVYARTTLIDRIDDTLKHVIEVVERSIVIQPIVALQKDYKVNLEASFRYNVNVVEDDRIDLEWFTSQEQLLWSTFSEPLNIPLHHNRRGETVSLSPERTFRQITETVKLDDKILGYLRVSHPWFEVTKPIHQLTRDLIIGIILMVICVGGIGWWLSGIAIEPVRQSYSSLKQFTADASHELRNPIATIQTNVQMALAYPEAEPQQQAKQLQIIERLTQRLGKLVNDLLFLARSDSGISEIDWQPVQMDALLIEVMEEQKTLAKQQKIILELNIIESEVNNLSENQFTILGDWDRLARLFTNLIANALESIKPQENTIELSFNKIIVELKKIKQNQVNRKIRDRHYQHYLEIKIKDTGKGIAESDLPYIFNRFYRVDPARSRQQNMTMGTGSGLGLAIAKAIVENHKGKITVESTLNIGTAFTVILPINISNIEVIN